MKQLVIIDCPTLYGVAIKDEETGVVRLPLTYTRDKGLIKNIMVGHDDFLFYETKTVSSLDGSTIQEKEESLENYKRLLANTAEDFVKVRATYTNNINRLTQELAILKDPNTEVIAGKDIQLLEASNTKTN